MSAGPLRGRSIDITRTCLHRWNPVRLPAALGLQGALAIARLPTGPLHIRASERRGVNVLPHTAHLRG
jgi:hypothetical protein